MRMFWDNVAWAYDIFANGINRGANRRLCAAVAELIRPGDRVLECACGTGLLSGVIAARCESLIATDFSEKMLKRARKKYGKLPNVKFEQGNILQLDYPDESFDAVVALVETYIDYFLLPPLVLFWIFFLVLEAAQIRAFAKGLTPCPRWCWIFSLPVGMAAAQLPKLLGNHPLPNAIACAWIPLANLWMFAGLLAVTKRVQKK